MYICIVEKVGMGMFKILNNKHKGNLSSEYNFDPEIQDAVIKSSICTGEMVAGFKNKSDGHFTEVMVIRNKEDEEYFKNSFGLDEVKKEY